MQEQFTFNKRLLSDTLAKYPDTFVALCEILNNAIQAEATTVDLQIDYTPTDELAVSDIKRIIVLDNGIGVRQSEFRWKILEVATEAKKGGKGIGRFAALQMASRMEIQTVAFDPIAQKSIKSRLALDTNVWNANSLDKVSVDVDFTPLEGKHDSYYRVTISDFYGAEVTSKDKHKRIHRNLQEKSISAALFATYPEQIFSGKVAFTINGKPINPEDS